LRGDFRDPEARERLGEFLRAAVARNPYDGRRAVLDPNLDLWAFDLTPEALRMGICAWTSLMSFINENPLTPAERN
jgi:hypothetical protein